MLKAVIFDMDGLMFDTERVCKELSQKAASAHGIQKVQELVLRTLGSSHEKVTKEWEREFGEKGKRILELREQYLNEYYRKNRVPEKKGLKELLKKLRKCGYYLAVASSTSEIRVRYFLESAGIEDYFCYVVCGDMVSSSKPDPEIYFRTAKGIGVKTEECFVLEDSRNGVMAAYCAGCRVIMVPDLWEPDKETRGMTEKVCRNLYEAGKYILSSEES